MSANLPTLPLELTQAEADHLLGLLGRFGSPPGSDPGAGLARGLHEKLANLRFLSAQCSQCGAPFNQRNPRQKTCSDRCRQALSRSKRVGHASPPPPATPNVAAPPPAEPLSQSGHTRAVTGLAAELQAIRDARSAEMEPRRKLWKEEAQRCGCTPERVESFRTQNRLGLDAPLTQASLDRLREEVERENVAEIGRRQWAADRVRAVENVSVSDLKALATLVAALPVIPSFTAAKSYLQGISESFERGQLAKLRKLIVERYPDAPTAGIKGNLFFGALLRLPDLDPMPTDPADFPVWCGLRLHRQHHYREGAGAPNFGDLLTRRMSENDARAQLGLPLGQPLTTAAINSAYRAQAKVSHPDCDTGDVDRFLRLKEAKERLLMEPHIVTVRL